MKKPSHGPGHGDCCDVQQHIDDDKEDRIKRALTPNDNSKITTEDYREKDLAELEKIQKTGSNALDKMSKIENKLSPVDITHDVSGHKKDITEMCVDATKGDTITHHEELSDKENIDENIDDNGPSLLVMPEDLMSHVLTYSATNTSSNLYALCELWDFAGQKEFYATHQAFLTSNAVYLVVADMNSDISKQSTSQCFANFQDVGGYVDFWFDSIHCHRTVDNPVTEHFEPPILLVFTGKDKCDKAQFTKRKEELDKQIDEVLGHRSKYHHLHEKFYLSNTEDSEEEFLTLQNAIFKTARKMDIWGKAFPLKWILLEQLIELNKDNGKNFITFTDMVNMGKHPDINILKKKDLLMFLRFQHNVGNVIFFENIPDLIILKPQWLADAFRCFVSDRVDNSRLHHLDDWILFKQYGKISESLITKLFKSKQGSQFSGQKVNLHKIMEKLDILVRIENSRFYMMPSKMPASAFEDVCKSVNIRTEGCKRTSWLCLKFDFLPPSFFNHLSAWFIRHYYPSKVDSASGSFALYRGICMFDIDRSGCEKILVTMSTDIIALQVVSFSKQQREVGDTCSNIYNKVKGVVEEIKESYRVKLSFGLNFKCSDGDFYKDTFDYDTLTNNQECFCPQHKTVHLSEKLYAPWMKTEVKRIPDRAKPITKQDDLNPSNIIFCIFSYHIFIL
ncbi:uncharacterized protein LOC127732278 [Mytilus californianus]|uniref:uncharacterized protein LOC127732278 n=1 Tax=Mytilus californianus TaxID=6549 RepID=UPI0022479CCA|nr:uncharacterized protein LOC127732278 [Mytilus californianus]